MKLIFLVGARPNFVKLAPLYAKVKEHNLLSPVIVHTGQHYDYNMSEVFFNQLKIPAPDYHLEIGSGTHAIQTAQIMIAFEKLCVALKPDMVIIIGDVNSTVAGALVASKLMIPLAHVEAGLRSFNKSMPEEINRIVSDHISDLLFVPSKKGIENLTNEGLLSKSYFTGDVMYDAVNMFVNSTNYESSILTKYKLTEKRYYVATLHRPYNVDNKVILKEIIGAFSKLDYPVVFSVHPRTLKNLREFNISVPSSVIITEPLGYLDFLCLENKSLKIITDSGGIQKEAYFLKVPCVTLRSETEWTETVEVHANILVKERTTASIVEAVLQKRNIDFTHPIYGEGNASELIVNHIITYLKIKSEDNYH